MANRLVLIPEDMYTSLMSISTNDHGRLTTPMDPEDDLLLNYTKNKLQRIRDAKSKINDTSKNLLYNQELRRYLKMRREAKDRPVKIELPKGLKGIITRDPNEHPLSSEKGRNVSVIDDRGEMQKIDFAPQLPINFDDWSMQDESDQENPNDTLTSPNFFTPQIPKRRQRFQEERNREFDRIRAFYSHIMEDPTKFNVSPEGNILHPLTNVPMKNTDLIASIERLVNPTPMNAPSPTGTALLRGKALKDPYLTNLMNERFVPMSTRLKQRGTGVISKNPKLKNLPKFRPSQWKN